MKSSASLRDKVAPISAFARVSLSLCVASAICAPLVADTIDNVNDSANAPESKNQVESKIAESTSQESKSAESSALDSGSTHSSAKDSSAQDSKDFATDFSTSAAPESKIAESKTLQAVRAVAHRSQMPEGEANIAKTSAQDIQSRQASTLSEVFAKDASISVGGASRATQKLYIRGLEDRLYSVNIDGASQFGSMFHHQGNVTIDPMMIKSITISKGIGQLESSAGALAGSVEVQTKDARDLLRRDASGALIEKFGGAISGSGFSNVGYRGSVALFGASEKTDALAYVAREKTFYFRDGNGTRVRGSEDAQNSWLLKLNHAINSKNKLSLSYSGVLGDAIAPFMANLASSDFSLYNFRTQNHSATLSHTYKPKGSSIAPSITSKLYFNNRDLALSRIGLAGIGDDEEARDMDIRLLNYGYMLSLDHHFHGILDSIKYGLNYQGSFITDRLAIPEGAHRNQESGNVYGAFVGATLSFLDSIALQAQSRYDVFTYFDRQGQSHLTQGFSPSLSLQYVPIDALALRLAYGMSTAGAMPSDASLLGNHEASISQNLKAQTSHNFEINMDFDKNSDLSEVHSQRFYTRASGYTMMINDFINSFYAGAHIEHGHEEHGHEGHTHSLNKQNLAEMLLIPGFELKAGYELANAYAYKIDINASIAQSFPMYRGHLLQDTYELGAVAGTQYNLGLSYNILRYGIKLSWLSNFTQRIAYEGYDIYNDERVRVDKGGYSVHNLYVNWTPKSARGLGVNLAITNIFNTFYISQTSPFKAHAFASGNNALRNAMPNPGINARLEISYQF
ncbi:MULTISPECIES: TonB-dependent receptor [unclassified Helicobacter]|uniref:TonB-dependent receptor n=1 Tax=unclassified Helicobacter TaxID=2593540 RepID=UPI0008055D67|nr:MULTISPECIES: TonB-dependent receptor [unclassified Helicobacter]OBV28846.1 hypothetical protein BA723_07895 [Helicobacter sp. CLO-3]